MKQLHVSNRAQWRRWLSENHAKETDGIWLVFYKKQTGKPSLEYDESVEEALCFGWIDSIIKRIDDNKYCRKFTPRKNGSKWSISNKKRIQKIVKEGRMTESGRAKIATAKKLGRWNAEPRPAIKMDIPPDLSAALALNKKAKDFFENLAPTYQKHFIGWIITAKRPETKMKRLQESLVLLARGEKLGLK